MIDEPIDQFPTVHSFSRIFITPLVREETFGSSAQEPSMTEQRTKRVFPQLIVALLVVVTQSHVCTGVQNLLLPGIPSSGDSRSEASDLDRLI